MSGKLFLREKLNKIVWFYSSQEHFNYFITRGTTQTLRLNKEEIMILQHLMIKMAEELGYCINMKEYKQNPDAYKGSIADVTGFIRVALTNKQNTPDIYCIMQVLGKEKTCERLKRV